jgi:hypothetical protein
MIAKELGISYSGVRYLLNWHEIPKKRRPSIYTAKKKEEPTSQEGGRPLSQVGASSPSRDTSLLTKKGEPKALMEDRSTVKGFRKYMLANPIYFTTIAGRVCTEANVAGLCEELQRRGLLSGIPAKSRKKVEVAA